MTSQSLATVFISSATVLCGCSGNPTHDTTRSGETSVIESSGDKDVKVTSFYTISKYDPQANPAEDLAATVKQASASGKRIILEIGGQW
jgi:hypothetical protein